MLEELKTKPTRKSVKQDADAAAKRAYGRSYRQAAIDTAKAEGAAAGVADAVGGGIDAPSSAVEAARQRALGATTAQAPAAPQPKAPTPSGRVIQQPDGSTVPMEFYDWSPADQKRFKELQAEQETKKAEDSLALKAVNQVLDFQDRDRGRIKTLTDQVKSLLSIVEELQRRLDEKDAQVKVSKSEALMEQQAAIADAVLNAAAVETSLRNQTVASKAAMEEQGAASRAALKAQATTIAALKGSVTSSTKLMGERSNAVLDQLAGAESRQSKLEVQQTENSDGIAANRDTLRAVTGTDFDSAIDLAVKRSFDDRLDGAMEALIERKYVLLGPTTGSDGIDQKRDDSAKPFLAEQVGDNATERAVNRALKEGGNSR